MRSLGLRFPLSFAVRAFAGLFGPRRITILGQEFAGDVVSLGEGVTRFSVGDRVFGHADMQIGTYAEYRCVPAEPGEQGGFIARIPPTRTYAEAAAIPLGGLEALRYLRAAELQQGERLLVIGAGGSIGTMVLQLARHRGARIDAVDTGAKAETLLAAGAERAIDFTSTDYLAEREPYDVIFDVVGKANWKRLAGRLNPGGRLILSNPSVRTLIRGSRTLPTGIRIITGGENDPADLDELAGLLEQGVIRPVIDSVRPFSDMVEAHRYVETGAKIGSLVLELSP